VPRLLLRDDDGPFDVTLVESVDPSRVVLFAVGGGGDPERHLPLLTALAEHGCTVVAPHFERLTSPSPTEGALLLRARRLRLALDAAARPGLWVAGVGHSIGTTMLLALAGGEAWMHPGHRLPIAPDARLERLVLLAPATGYFQAPAALDGVGTPLLVWAGTRDPITPPSQAELLAHALGPRVPVELRVVEGAGHFSFMHVPPPQTTEPLPDRDAFLAELTAEVCRFVRR
jgi:pimeloyl-ACP methyl ester carboxylesterase